MRVRVVAVVPVVAAVLVGCTAEAAPEPTPLPPAPRVSASPTTAVASPIALPSAAVPATPQGASAFARYYLAVLSEAFNTGDVTHLRAISHSNCGTCDNFRDAAERDAAEGKRLRGGRFRPISAEATESAAGDALVDVYFARDASAKVNRNGKVLSEVPAVGRDFLQMRTVRVGSRWLARGIRFPGLPT